MEFLVVVHSVEVKRRETSHFIRKVECAVCPNTAHKNIQ